MDVNMVVALLTYFTETELLKVGKMSQIPKLKILSFW